MKLGTGSKRKSIRKFAEHGGQARVLAVVQFHVIRPVLWLLLLLGSFGAMCLQPITEWAQERAYGQDAMAMGSGYSPTSMNVSNLPQAQVVAHDKSFVKNLKANTPYVRCCARRTLEENSGNQLRLYMYQPLGSNVSQAADGVVGSGIQVSVSSNTSTIGNYADYVNVSRIALQTAIDPALENIQKELAYRLGLTLSTLVKNTADGMATIDGSVDDLNKTATSPFTRSDITAAVQSLAGRNVQPFNNGKFVGVIHPFIVGDALNDTSNNSLVDILKRTSEGQEKLSELPSPDGDEVQVLDWSGVAFYSSTLVKQTANYSGSTSTALRTYIFGEDALIAISLGAKEGAKIGNGDWRNLKLWMMRADGPTVGDAAMMIGGWTAYNVDFTVTTPPDTTMRGRTIDAVNVVV